VSDRDLYAALSAFIEAHEKQIFAVDVLNGAAHVLAQQVDAGSRIVFGDNLIERSPRGFEVTKVSVYPRLA
jgi:hypothetical protein